MGCEAPAQIVALSLRCAFCLQTATEMGCSQVVSKPVFSCYCVHRLSDLLVALCYVLLFFVNSSRGGLRCLGADGRLSLSPVLSYYGVLPSSDFLVALCCVLMFIGKRQQRWFAMPQCSSQVVSEPVVPYYLFFFLELTSYCVNLYHQDITRHS